MEIPRRLQQRGFLFPLALIFLGVLLLLLLNLTALGRTGDQIFFKEELRFQKALHAFQTQNSLGVQLVDPNLNPPGPASFERDFKVTYEEVQLAVK